jgi:hypothetical protein
MVAEETEKEKEKLKLKEKEVATNNKQNKKGKNAFSSFLLTVITGQNIAVRNNENNFDQNTQNLDLQIPDSYWAGQFSNIFPREKNEEKNRDLKTNSMLENNKIFSVRDEDTTTTSKSYTLTEEVQRVLIEDFFPPISSSTVPGNPGRLFITLSTEKN